METVGQHCLFDAYGIDAAWAKDAKQIEALLIEAALAAEATILGSHFHTFGEGGGVTGVLLLAESHLSIHTWPEYHYAALDIFMCGQHRIDAAVQLLRTQLQAKHTHTTVVSRGSVPNKSLTDSAHLSLATSK